MSFSTPVWWKPIGLSSLLTLLTLAAFSQNTEEPDTAAFQISSVQVETKEEPEKDTTTTYTILLDNPDKTPRFFLGINYFGVEADISNEGGIMLGFGLDLNYFPTSRNWIKASGYMPYSRGTEVYSDAADPAKVNFPRYRRIDLLHTWYFFSRQKKERGLFSVYNTNKAIRGGLRSGLFHYNHFISLLDFPIAALPDGTGAYLHGYSAIALDIGFSRLMVKNFVVRQHKSNLVRNTRLRHWYVDLLWHLAGSNRYHIVDSVTEELQAVEADLDIPFVRPGFRIGFESLVRFPQRVLNGLHVNWEYSIRPRPVFESIPPVSGNFLRAYDGHVSIRVGVFLIAPENI